MLDLTRCDRLEAALLEARDVIADYAPGFTVLLDEIDAALALPPDPQPQTGALRELLREGVELVRYPNSVELIATQLAWKDRARKLLAAPAPAVPELVADAERERRVAEWMRRITAARFNNDTPAFDRAVLDAIDIMRDRDAEVARLRAELTRLSGQSGSCAECERLTKERNAGWEALERLRERMRTTAAADPSVEYGLACSHWGNEIDKALAARPAQGKEGA